MVDGESGGVAAEASDVEVAASDVAAESGDTAAEASAPDLAAGAEPDVSSSADEPSGGNGVAPPRPSSDGGA